MRVTAAMTAAAAASAPGGRKIYVVTGATDGIGRLTATKLGADGHTVCVHGRTRSKVDAVVAAVNAGGGDGRGFVADLSSLADVRRLGADVAAAVPHVDGLLNNAGTFDGDYTGARVLTADGNEYSLAVNVLAPFLLTALLLDRVRAAPGGGRILVTSSVSMGAADALGDLQCADGWSGHRAYALSKLCCAMVAVELDARYGDAPRLCANTMDPGTVNTKMLRAGWGACGIPVAAATRSYDMLTAPEWGATSGRCAGASMDRKCGDAAARAALWADLVRLTGAAFPAPLSCKGR